MAVRSWSYSSLKMFESCAARFKYEKIEKRPVGPQPALERGTQIHAALEAAVVNGHPPRIDDRRCDVEPLKLPEYIAEIRARDHEVEKMWAFGSNWGFLGIEQPELGKFLSGAWLRAKLDVYLRPIIKRRGGVLARVIDWKTGRKYDDHEQQAELYAIGAMRREQRELDEVEVDMVYLDQGTIEKWTIPLAEIEEMQGEWNERAQRLLTARSYPATPGRECGWCPFSQRKKGPCRAG